MQVAPIEFGAARREPGVIIPARSTRRGRLWAEALDMRARRPAKKLLTGLRAIGIISPPGGVCRAVVILCHEGARRLNIICSDATA